MFDYSGFKSDPDNVGSVLCWACYSMDPWHLAGIYHTEDDAKKMLEVLGKGYQVSYGSHAKNTDDFIGGL